MQNHRQSSPMLKTALGCAGLIVCGAVATAAAAPPRYTIALVPTPEVWPWPAGTTKVYSMAINEAGEVAGWMRRPYSDMPWQSWPGRDRAFVYINGAVTVFEDTPDHSYAYDINDNRQVVGQAFSMGTLVGGEAFFWENGVFTMLGAPVQGSSRSTARVINNSGQAAGWSERPSGARDTFLWDGKTGMQHLGNLAGFQTDVTDIDSQAQVIAGSQLWNGQQWQNPGIHARALNEAGVVAGTVGDGWTNPIEVAILQDGEVTVLTQGVPIAINDAGIVLYHTAANQPAIYFDGQTHLLQDLIPPDSSWQLVTVTSINNAGQITGHGLYPGQYGMKQRAFILTPVPAPMVGDVTGDGVVNVNDLLAVINDWGPCPAPPQNCPADIFPAPSGDGVVNVNDLLMVISNWSP